MASAEHSFSALKQLKLIKEFNDSTEIKPLYALTCALLKAAFQPLRRIKTY